MSANSATSRAERLARYRTLRARQAPRISLTAFRALVAEALDTLPNWVRQRVDNVAVVVEERPASDRLSRLGYAPSQSLLGLYEGISHLERGGGYHLVAPDRITLYRQPILAEAGPRAGLEAIKREVRDTIVHEVAHHFGMDDAELEQLEGRVRQSRQPI